MAKFCNICGSPLQEGRLCSCQTKGLGQPQSVMSLIEPHNFFFSMWDTIVSFAKKPVDVVSVNVKRNNWIAAAVFVGISVILQVLATVTQSSRYSHFGRITSTIVFKALITELLLFGIVILALFVFSRLFDQGSSDLLRTFVALGISSIAFAAASILVILFNLAFSDLNPTIMNFGKAFTLVTALLAIKRIGLINRDESLVFIAACTVACYTLGGYVISRLLQ